MFKNHVLKEKILDDQIKGSIQSKTLIIILNAFWKFVNLSVTYA